MAGRGVFDVGLGLLEVVSVVCGLVGWRGCRVEEVGDERMMGGAAC